LEVNIGSIDAEKIIIEKLMDEIDLFLLFLEECE
jgi:hypothetical protein